MDNNPLDRLFRDNLDDLDDTDNRNAIYQIRLTLREAAFAINKHVQESASKNDILTRLFRIGVDAELAIRMDGVSRTVSPIVMTRQ